MSWSSGGLSSPPRAIHVGGTRSPNPPLKLKQRILLSEHRNVEKTMHLARTTRERVDVFVPVAVKRAVCQEWRSSSSPPELLRMQSVTGFRPVGGCRVVELRNYAASCWCVCRRLKLDELNVNQVCCFWQVCSSGEPPLPRTTWRAKSGGK